MKIVIRAPNWIGDCLMSIPAIESLASNYPKARIWVAAKGPAEEIFYHRKDVHGIIRLPDLPDSGGLKEEAGRLRAESFDAGLLLTNSFASAWSFYLAKIPERWGYGRDGRGLLLTRRISKRSGVQNPHQVYKYLNLIIGLELKTIPPKLSFPLTEQEASSAEQLFMSLGIDRKNPVIILNPGGYYGSAKRWPPKQFGTLAALLHQRLSAQVLLIGSEAEKSQADIISKELPGKIFNLTGKTSLRRLAAVFSSADLCVTNDSGPMHLAVAAGLPTIALFGPTDPSVTGPFQKPSQVMKKDVVCWPCSYRDCPFDHRCMMEIDPEEVFFACREMLS